MIAGSEKPIFLQLADTIKNDIMDGKLKPFDRIPSVRELAATYEINNNTAMRTVETLANQEVIFQKRGMGYFVSPTARQIIREQKYKNFTEKFLPQLKTAMHQLSITSEQLLNMLKET